MKDRPAIVWFRQDLRLADNPALIAAINTGRPILPLYILDEESAGIRPLGEASRWWLYHSLSNLNRNLASAGSTLILKKGKAETVLDELITETGAAYTFWNRCYEPSAIARDIRIKKMLTRNAVTTKSFNASLLFEPWEIKSKQDRPYRVFTPFYKAILSKRIMPPYHVAQPIRQWKGILQSDKLNDWALLPSQPDWADGFKACWTPGETAAYQRLKNFLDGPISSYKEDREIPGLSATSKLSPYIHFGEISPRQIWEATTARDPCRGAETFLKELIWREFGYHLLYQKPEMATEPIQCKFNNFPWLRNAKHLKAWQRGQTGYPIVDAGMRELWTTGTMHNRVRMIVASFLVKHLLIHWSEGEAWFWDTLVDADLASNSANWQWVAGCGADAAPYFRVFNPIIQGSRFDSDGRYVRRWVPEISHLPNKYLHTPWLTGKAVLAKCRITLGETYPNPIVDHKAARERALAAYKSISTLGS